MNNFLELINNYLRTRGKVPARVRHRLLAIEHSVGLHLIRRSGRQLLQIVLQ